MAYPVFNDEQRWSDITQTPSWQNPSPSKIKKDKSYLAARSRMAAIQEFLPSERATENMNASRTSSMPSSYPQPFRTNTMAMPNSSASFGNLTSSNDGNTRFFPSTPGTRADNLSATSSDGLALRSMGGFPSDTGSTGLPRISDRAYGGMPSRRSAPPRTRPTRPGRATPETSGGGAGVMHGLSRSLEFYHALTRHSEGGNAEILRAYQGNNE